MFVATERYGGGWEEMKDVDRGHKVSSEGVKML
jgi:hypothetical protein